MCLFSNSWWYTNTSTARLEDRVKCSRSLNSKTNKSTCLNLSNNSWCSMIQKIVWKIDMLSTLKCRLLHVSQHDELHNNLILTLWLRWRHAHYLFKHALGLGAQWASGSFCTQTWRHWSIRLAPPLCCETE